MSTKRLTENTLKSLSKANLVEALVDMEFTSEQLEGLFRRHCREQANNLEADVKAFCADLEEFAGNADGDSLPVLSSIKGMLVKSLNKVANLELEVNLKGSALAALSPAVANLLKDRGLTVVAQSTIFGTEDVVDIKAKTPAKALPAPTEPTADTAPTTMPKRSRKATTPTPEAQA